MALRSLIWNNASHSMVVCYSLNKVTCCAGLGCVNRVREKAREKLAKFLGIRRPVYVVGVVNLNGLQTCKGREVVSAF